MTEKIIEFKKRYSEIIGKLELLKLENDIKEFMISEAINMLPLKAHCRKVKSVSIVR